MIPAVQAPPRDHHADDSSDTRAQRQSFARRVVIAVSIAIGIAAVAMFLWYSVDVLLLAFASILVASMLRGMANWLAQKTRLPVGGALAVVIVSLLGALVVLGVLLAPSIAQQFEQLADSLPASVQSVEQRLRQQSWGRKLLGENEPPVDVTTNQSLPASTQPATTSTTTNVVGQALHAATRPSTIIGAANYARKAAEGLFTFVLVLIVGLYLAAQPRMYVEGVLKLFPQRERPRLREVMHRIGRTLQFWLLGQLVPMAAIGTFIGVGLYFIGIPLWLPLGLLAALLNFIPNFGPIIAAVPALLIALANDPTKALWVIVLNVAAQNLEGYLITPLVQRKAVAMPPALTILSQVLMGLLLGPLGVILAAPLTAATIVAVKLLYVEDTLGTPTQTPEHAPPS